MENQPAGSSYQSTDSEQQPRNMASLTKAKQSEVMAKLWRRMGEIYGLDRWERSYGAESSAVWLSVLGPRTLDDLARGIGRAEQDTSGRIPTLGEFSAWCREYQPGTFAGASLPGRDGRRMMLADSAENIAKRCLANRARLANIRKGIGV